MEKISEFDWNGIHWTVCRASKREIKQAATDKDECLCLKNALVGYRGHDGLVLLWKGVRREWRTLLMSTILSMIRTFSYLNGSVEALSGLSDEHLEEMGLDLACIMPALSPSLSYAT